MTIRVYNTLSRAKEVFTPRDPGRASVYVCGVTPYDHSHVGHARPSIVWDVIRNYLEYSGLQVRLVQNFTDVDDKIIARSQQQGRPALELSSQYAAEYLQSMEKLGIREADIYSKVSEHLEDIVEMIQGLVDRGLAYPLDGDVYYDVTRFSEYGKLSGRTLEELRAGARIEVDERKRSPGDFALWKGAKPGEPAWPSPWGPGRPGWHIECSAMSLRYLGSGFDFHGGGSDLIFPHHENEIAQSEGYTGEPFVRYWVHNGLVNLRSEKMSKSVGNVVTLNDLLDRFPAGAIRLFMLTTHYRSPLDFEEALVKEAEAGWSRLANTRRVLVDALRALEGADTAGTTRKAAAEPGWGRDGAVRAAELKRELDALAGAPAPGQPAEDDLREALLTSRQRLEAAMDDDFNTALAIGTLFDFSRAINTYLGRQAAGQPPALLPLTARWYLLLGDLFGLFSGVKEEATGDVGEAAMRILIELRQEARQEKNWGLADRIRDRLAEAAILIEDTPTGPKWKKS